MYRVNLAVFHNNDSQYLPCWAPAPGSKNNKKGGQQPSKRILVIDHFRILDIRLQLASNGGLCGGILSVVQFQFQFQVFLDFFTVDSIL